MQDWKKRCKPSMTLPIPKGTSVEAMAVVEDFIYLNCSKSPSIIQVTWISFFFFYIDYTIIMLKKGKLIPVLEHNVLLGDLYLITNFGLYSENCSQSVVTMFLVLNGTNIDYHQCTNKNQGTQKNHVQWRLACLFYFIKVYKPYM